ncbi:craniofacial development protein 2-like [Achroia grisella]|uniref:craniofacial development protein 2-like n=1 Tax=Achroia grisella TaxID=688607 RepID=UPI0027D1FF1C|nr:craniofacial development protein 2-like [Achroia grisella]
MTSVASIRVERFRDRSDHYSPLALATLENLPSCRFEILSLILPALVFMALGHTDDGQQRHRCEKLFAIANPHAQRGDYGHIPPMTGPTQPWPLVPGRSAIPGQGGGYGNGRARGAKNPRATVGRQHSLTLATYNGRTLRLDEHLAQLEEELKYIRWHILGLCEVRREGEDTMTLESGHLMYFREGEQPSQGGVGFLVHKTLINNVVEISSVSNRVAYLVLKLTERYSLKVVQVYAPTSAHSDDEVESMYEDISKAIHNTSKAFYNIVMGDFNAKVGIQTGSESTAMGPHGFGSRNHRGQMLVNFLEKEGLFLMNSFFKKQPQRKWTWQSPDSMTKNEIDFILTDKKRIFRDVSVITRFKTVTD